MSPRLLLLILKTGYQTTISQQLRLIHNIPIWYEKTSTLWVDRIWLRACKQQYIILFPSEVEALQAPATATASCCWYSFYISHSFSFLLPLSIVGYSVLG